MRAGILIAVYVAAFFRSLACHASPSLRAYLAAMLIGGVGIECFAGYGKASPVFAIAYYIGTSIILLSMLGLVANAAPKNWQAALGLAVAAFVVWRTRAGLHPLTAWDRYSTAFYLLEGGIEAFCGTALLFAMKSKEKLEIGATLGFLWLALAWFRLAMALNMYSPVWVKLNEVLPTTFVVGALAWVGLNLRPQRTA